MVVLGLKEKVEYGPADRLGVRMPGDGAGEIETERERDKKTERERERAILPQKLVSGLGFWVG